MVAVPEPVLRKMYDPDSFQTTTEGFSFELTNNLLSVTLTGLVLTIDNQLRDPGSVTLVLKGGTEMPAGGIANDSALLFKQNATLRIRVAGALPRSRLVIRAETREAGPIQFSIPFTAEPVKAKKKIGGLKKLALNFRYAARVFKAQQDPQHPVYHYAPPANWMNDPNGLIYWKGNYHLFFQYNPVEPVWGNTHWGHALSKDLIHWKHLPIALSPDSDGADAGGCFSGCMVNNNGKPTILYTGVFPEKQYLATSEDDELILWNKRRTAVITSPPEGMQLEGFRDPCVWQEGGEWRMVLGSGITGAGGAVLLYRSRDLLEWESVGVLFSGQSNLEHAGMTTITWECPSLFPLGDRWVLIVSALSASGPLHTVYYTGQYAVDRFIPDGPPHLLDGGAGACFYAPQTFIDRKGRRLMFGWLREARDVEAQQSAGWSGAMSLPRVLSLSERGKVCSSPEPALKKLRKGHERLSSNGQVSKSIHGGMMEIIVNIPPDVERWSGVHISEGESSKKGVLVGYDCQNGMALVDCRYTGGMISAIPVDPPALVDLTLHIFIDGSVIEVFVQEMYPISARFYSEKPQNLRIRTVGDAWADCWSLRL